MRVLWLPEAVRDLERLREFLKPKNPAAMARATARVRLATAALADRPQLGRAVEGAPGLRDLVVPFGGGAYLLRYRVDPEAVVIARVWHGREERGDRE
jgi:plasmid stabilization system protein ParE